MSEDIQEYILRQEYVPRSVLEVLLKPARIPAPGPLYGTSADNDYNVLHSGAGIPMEESRKMGFVEVEPEFNEFRVDTFYCFPCCPTCKSHLMMWSNTPFEAKPYSESDKSSHYWIYASDALDCEEEDSFICKHFHCEKCDTYMQSQKWVRWPIKKYVIRSNW